MTAAGPYKLDVGDSCCSNGFPIRSFFYLRKEGAGHWLVAHRNEVEQKYRSGTRKPEGHSFVSKSIASECTKVGEYGTSHSPANTLDGHLLMTLHCVDKPSDLCSVDISEQRLNAVKTEDLVDFENVAYVNASDNSLTIEPFRNFFNLRELELSLNGLCNITLTAEDFPHLEVLDLSYNNLSGDDVMSLGLLPSLKVLHLTGNHLQSLPPNLTAPHQSPSQLAMDHGMRFQSLEMLMLDDNKLSSEVFSSLANLKRLQHLNLQQNYISEVPCMQQRGLLHQQWEQDTGNYSHSQGLATKDVTDWMIDDDRYEHIKNSSEDYREYREELSGWPLPELHFLNLADNQIVAEEALLAAAVFPRLSEIVIHSNPLTTQRSGDPPLLTYFLQEKLGIKIRRKKTSIVVKPPLILSVDFSKRKVKTKIPKVPKLPLLPAAPGSCSYDDNGSLEEEHAEDLCQRDSVGQRPLSQDSRSTEWSGCSSKTKAGENEEASIATAHTFKATDGVKESQHDTHQHGEAFFVTQVEDVDESEYHLQSDKIEELRDVAIKESNENPGKLKGYELLLDAKPDPDMVEPVGIQQTVRMLEQTLKNLLVYRDSKPKLDCLQKPYKEKEKKIGKLPSQRPRKQRGERLDDILNQIKERKTISEVPLKNILEGQTVDKEEYEEVLALLKDMKKNRKGVHMKFLEQATRIECERTTSQT